jgi:hypothetical protein
MEERFLGRERELEILKRLLTKKSASLVVIKEEMAAQINNFEISILENSDKAVKKL